MKTRQQWLAMLAKLVAPMQAATAAKALGDMLPMLTDFPDAAFTLASLDAIACKANGVPNYANLRDLLGTWWKEHRPPQTAIAADQPATIKQREIEREVADSWTSITPEQIRRKIRELNGNPRRDMLGRFLAGAVAKHAPKHLGLLPPHWLKAHNELPEVAEQRAASIQRAAAAEVHYDTRKGPPL